MISLRSVARAALIVLSLTASAAIAQPKPTLLHTPPAQGRVNEALRIEGSLLGGSKVDKVIIHYRGPGEAWAEAPMELQYGDLFRGFIPAERMVPPGVEYFIEGIGFDRSKIPLFASAQKPYRLVLEGRVLKEKPDDRQEAKGPDEDPMLATDEDDAAKEPPPKNDAVKKESPDDAFANEPPAEEKKGKKGKKGKEVAIAEEPPHKEEARRDEVRKEEPPRREENKKKPRSELEEELLLYGAEDTVALATRHEEKVTRVPAIASSYTRAQIRALGVRTVYELLDYVPGLSVSRDVQGFYRVGIRGLRSDPEVLVLLNGHRLNNFFDGRALANLPIENIERIEVVRGPGSSLYGSGAFLGVVNIVTDKSDGVRGAAVAGSYDAVDGHLSGGLTNGDLHLFVDGDVNSQLGYLKTIDRDNLTASRVAQNLNGDLRVNDKRLLINVGGGAEYANEKVGRIGLSLRYMTEDRGALIGLFDVLGRESRLQWNVLLADVTYERVLTPSTTLRLRGYFDAQNTNRLFQITPRNFTVSGGVSPTGCAPPTCAPEGLKERTALSTQTFGVDAAADTTFSDTNRLTVGLNVEQQAMPTYAYVANYDAASNVLADFQKPSTVVYPQDVAKGAATRRLSLGLYGQDQWTPIQRLTLTLGLRLDAIELPRLDGSGQIAGSALVPSVNPRAGVVLAVTDALVVKFLYGRAFRAPTVEELTESIPATSLNQGRFAGNPGLRPATVDALEFGADYVQAVADARIRLRTNAFYESFLSPIAPVDTTGNIVPLRNRLGVRTFGAEGEARLEVSNRANAFFNVAWFRAVDVETPPQAQLLTDTPQVRFNTGGTLPIGDWLNLDLNLRYGAERRSLSRSQLELVRRYRIPAYAVVTAQLRTEPLWDHIELAVLAQNVFQQELFDDPIRPDRITGLIPREGFEAFGIIRGSY